MRKHKKVGNIILKKIYFPKKNKSQNRYQFISRLLKLSQEKMFNNNTIKQKMC